MQPVKTASSMSSSLMKRNSWAVRTLRLRQRYELLISLHLPKIRMGIQTELSPGAFVPEYERSCIMLISEDTISGEIETRLRPSKTEFCFQGLVPRYHSPESLDKRIDELIHETADLLGLNEAVVGLVFLPPWFNTLLTARIQQCLFLVQFVSTVSVQLLRLFFIACRILLRAFDWRSDALVQEWFNDSAAVLRKVLCDYSNMRREESQRPADADQQVLSCLLPTRKHRRLFLCLLESSRVSGGVHMLAMQGRLPPELREAEKEQNTPAAVTNDHACARARPEAHGSAAGAAPSCADISNKKEAGGMFECPVTANLVPLSDTFALKCNHRFSNA